MTQTANDVSNTREFDLADPNDLALAYMVVIEKGVADAERFRRQAETELVVSFMDLRRPVLERLYQDLVVHPPMLWDTARSPLAQMLRVWAKRGEVYRHWQKRQTAKRTLFPEPLPNRSTGEWKEVPSVFWLEEDQGKMPTAEKLTSRQWADMQAYNQRYREFYNLPPGSEVKFDPYLDFKIRMTLTSKMRDAGPFATLMGLKVILLGGTPEEVMHAIDAAGAFDGLASTGPSRGSASDKLALSRGSDGLEPGLSPSHQLQKGPPTPLPPILMNPEYSRKLPPGEQPIYRHTIHGGGFDDILTNQRMKATYSKQFGGNSSGVRAYNGPFRRPVPPGPHPHIEFTTDKKANYRRFFGESASEWPMEDGAYLDIKIKNVIHPDGTVEAFKGPPPAKQPKLVVPQLPIIPVIPRAGIVPQAPISPAVPMTEPRSPPPAARKLTMKEWMVLGVLTETAQTVSGIYLQTGIWDAELTPMLDMLVNEGYAEKEPDPQSAGHFLYKGSRQWIQFKKK